MPGKFIVLVGLPGTGKDSVRRAFQLKHPEYTCVKTYTTRPQRPTEIDEAHDIISEEEFKKLIAENKLVEYVYFAGHYYGTPIEVFKKNLETVAAGGKMIQILDPEGAVKLSKVGQSLIVLFDIPPEEAARRASLRGTPNAEIDERIARDSAIIAENPEVFKNRIINKEGELEDSVRQLEALASREEVS